ncbi:MAG: O-Antigen ligase [Pedosphaera sp.]|nr:O-Antigen ligase [Pedosphaera sp.]
MSNSFVVPKTHIIYAICLPLAVLVGYFLADLDSGSMAVVVLVLSVLSIPLLMRWHHLFVIMSWNATCCLFFLPGKPYLWMLAAVISFFFSLLNRSVRQNLGFIQAPGVARSLIFLAAVVFATAFLTGGAGLRVFGAESFGGKKYVYVIMAIVGYFALAGQRIDAKRAGWYVAIFFLSTLAILFGYVFVIGGSSFGMFYELFPTDTAIQETGSAFLTEGIVRFGALSIVMGGVFAFVMARYGIRGLLDLTRPWRLLLFSLAVVGSLFCGFRSIIINFFLIVVCMFYFEGLFRTRYFVMVLAGGLLAGALALPFVHKMPLSVQRTLSFLPINVDQLARADAEGSTAWRLDMWKEALPEVPKHLLLGKGYAIDPDDLFMSSVSAYRGFALGSEGSKVSGDYHSGPLSLIIPFGLFGVGAFLWFLCAALRVLYQNYRFGGLALQNVNTFLLAYFIVQIVSFFFIFGSLYSGLSMFTGLVGLSVSLNGGTCRPPEATAEDTD